MGEAVGLLGAQISGWTRLEPLGVPEAAEE